MGNGLQYTLFCSVLKTKIFIYIKVILVPIESAGPHWPHTFPTEQCDMSLLGLKNQ